MLWEKFCAEVDAISEEATCRWQKEDFDSNYFCNIVSDSIRNHWSDVKVTLEDILKNFSNVSRRVPQQRHQFSDMQLVLFDNGILFAELLVWWNRGTSIHDHGFSGVLLQVNGSSLEFRYSASGKSISARGAIDEIVLDEVVHTRCGDERVILPGRTLCHFVYHLEKPTVSLIFRTHIDQTLSPQQSYFPPFLVLSHESPGINLSKKIAVLRMLRDVDPDRHLQRVFAEIEEAGHSSRFWLIRSFVRDMLSSRTLEKLNSYGGESRLVLEKVLRSAFESYRFSETSRIGQDLTSDVDPPEILAMFVVASTWHDFDLIREKLTHVSDEQIASVRDVLLSGLPSHVSALSEVLKQ